MKNCLKFLVLTLLSITFLTSCNEDDDNSWYEEQQKELARIDSTKKAQAPILKTYAEEHLGSSRTLDTATGIWFEILTPNTDDSYNFINQNGALNNFLVKAKYEGKLVLTGATFETNTEGADFTANGVISAWQFAIFPKSVTLNGNVQQIGGLTANGVKKGGKIRFITPSTLAYDNYDRKDASGAVKIPANSPLDFTIEVMDIK